ncbi:MAG: hypothetical protein PHY34_02235 [Patescibacteria group bacterium]|nr:hypothetical protein [Patescibacteria group bacterium]MDD5715247.1 hypothetical protein [Patescibacteria group bacterium]
MKTSPLQNNDGAIAIIALMAISVFALITLTTLSVLATSELKMAAAETKAETTFYAAESGINEALYQLTTNPVPQPLSFNQDGTTVAVLVLPDPSNPYQRIIESQASDPTGKVRTLRITANTHSYSGSFDYAVQTGEGGFEILNNSKVVGDVYTNGSIFGGTGAAIQALVDGDAWVARGTAETLGPVQENADVNYAVANAADTTDVSQSFVTAIDSPLKKVGFYIKRNGTLPGNVTLRIVRDQAGSPSTDTIVSKIIQKNTFPTAMQWLEISFDIGPVLSAGVPYWIVLDSPSFNASKYLVWDLNTNPASYADGEAKKSSDFETEAWSALNNDFKFRTYLGYGNTFVRQIETNGDLHANTIEKSEIHGDAYYQTIVDTDPDGASYPGTTDPDPKPYPITDVHINNWKNDALAGGTITGDQTISGTATLGPKKIEGNLTLSGNAHLIVNGTLWVTGTITFTNPGISISLDPSFGPASSVIIADGKIELNNNATISGSGDPKSYLLILSTNNSLNPASPAINAANNSTAVVYFAKNGMIRIYNGSHLHGTTGYYLTLEEGSTVEYDPNLAEFTIPAGETDVIGAVSGSWGEY